MTGYRRPLVERFWSMVDVRGEDECWPWQGARLRKGYGVIREAGRGSKNLKAHRLSWNLAHPEDPVQDDEVVRHFVCDHPWCQNPAHLAKGTQQDNIDDRDAHGHTSKGSDHYYAIYCEADIPVIFALREQGYKLREIAEEVGGTISSVAHVLYGDSWRHVPHGGND